MLKRIEGEHPGPNWDFGMFAHSRSMAAKILIVEDEARIVRTLRLYLENAGYSVSAVYDGSQALYAFRQEQPALVILDLNLPGADGLDVCRSLRRNSNVPIIMLTARIEEADRLVGLELGADDYIVKPFSPREVVARVRAVLRRASGDQAGTEIIYAGDLILDLVGFQAWLGSDPLILTHTEFNLLTAMAGNPGRVFTRQQLLDGTTGVTYEGLERNIDQHVKNLRRKIRMVIGDVEVIRTVYGVGYRLDPVVLTERRE
jgi:two-component system alkaline phosphatase synthesis response regulator PhoP